jgi:D-psicose/D-tagatose/L-ribulose 3-epimerase
MYRYSATQWIYGNEEIETSLQRLKRFGYDGVELAGEPASLNVEEVNRLLREYGLICTSICGIYTRERDLSSPNPDIRRNAVQYVKDCVDLAVGVGAALVIVVPSPVGKNAPDTTYEEEWGNAVASIREAGEYAMAKGIHLALEALNRFETYLVNRLDDAKKLAEQTKVDSVKLMADLFHMNIEERDLSATLRNIAPVLAHVHIADNTREAAGLGATDFKQVMRTLIEIGYQGSITMEFLPPVSNPYLAAQREAGKSNAVFDRYTQQSIDHIKHFVASLS